MQLDLPYYVNDGDGNQCMQACMRIAIKHFLDKDISLDDLDKMTGRSPNMWTFPAAVVTSLYDLGLSVKYFSKEEIEPFLGGEGYYRKHFGSNADKILRFTDMDVVISSIKNLLNYDLFSKKLLPWEEIEQSIDNGELVLIVIDYNRLVKSDRPYHGHMVVLTGYDKNSIYFHDPGPINAKANKSVSKDLFLKAWNADGTDNDVVIVSGIRK